MVPIQWVPGVLATSLSCVYNSATPAVNSSVALKSLIAPRPSYDAVLFFHGINGLELACESGRVSGTGGALWLWWYIAFTQSTHPLYACSCPRYIDTPLSLLTQIQPGTCVLFNGASLLQEDAHDVISSEPYQPPCGNPPPSLQITPS